jgi:hypothetical protein
MYIKSLGSMQKYDDEKVFFFFFGTRSASLYCIFVFDIFDVASSSAAWQKKNIFNFSCFCVIRNIVKTKKRIKSDA